MSDLPTLYVEKKSLDFVAVEGTVLSSSKHAETHISSSGGGGYVGPAGGHVSATNIKSKIVIKQEFWIKKPDGGELAVKVVGREIPIRDGQQVICLFGNQPQENRSAALSVFNRNAGVLSKAMGTDNIIEGFKLEPAFTRKFDYIVWGLLLWIGISSGYYVSVPFWGVVIFWIVVQIPRAYIRFSKLRTIVEAHLARVESLAFPSTKT